MRMFLAPLLFLAACTAPPGPALGPAQSPPQPLTAAPACRPLHATAVALAQRYGVRQVFRLTGETAERFIRAYNASEPPSDLRADTVLILVSGAEAAVVFGLADCVVEMGSAPLARVQGWARGLATGEMGA